MSVAARIHSRAAVSVASTHPTAAFVRSVQCHSRNSGTALDRWQFLADSFRLPPQWRPSTQLLGRRALHSNNSSRKPELPEAKDTMPGQDSKALDPLFRNQSLQHRPRSRQQPSRSRTFTRSDPEKTSATSSTSIYPGPSFAPESDALPMDPETDYWREYQDSLNSLRPVTDAELLRLRQWLRIKGRLMTKDEVRKLESILTESRKRRFPICYDSYNDLLHFYIKSQRYPNASRCLDTIAGAKERKRSEQRTRTEVLRMAMHLKTGDDAAFDAMFERDLDGIKVYMDQLLQWTKGLQLKEDDYSRLKSALHALQLKLCAPGTTRFTSLIGYLIGEDKPLGAKNLFFHTLDIGFPADVYASSAVISGLLKSNLVDEAIQVWDRVIVQPELKTNIRILNALLGGLSNSPRYFEAACFLWDRIIQDPSTRPDIYSFSTMINIYFRTNNPDSAMALWKAMQEEPYNIQPNEIAYNSALKGLFDNLQPEMAKGIYGSLVAREDLDIPRDTYHIMLQGLLSVRDVEGVADVFSRMKQKGLEPDTTTYTIIADRLFSQRDSKSGLKVFELMSSNGIPTNDIAYSAVIAGLAKVGSFKQAQGIFKQMKSAGFEPTIHTYGALIQGALKVGDVGFAEEIVQVAKTKIKDGLSDDTYTILIGGYAHLLNMERALHWLNEMRHEKSEAITWKHFYVLLQPCVEHQLWEPASEVVAVMKELQYDSRVPRLNRLIEEVERVRSGGAPRTRGTLYAKLTSSRRT